jgi:plastocyanin
LATPTPGTESPAPASPSPGASASPSAEATASAAVEITLVAQDSAFDAEELTVPAGATVQLTLENRDPIPHNFALYLTDAADESLFVGETFSGPGASRTYEFTAPSEPGEYFFRCDIHPQLMTGTFIVE